jgi:protein-S-isoprenylcysteine O-methyltransferase Ste14
MFEMIATFTATMFLPVLAVLVLLTWVSVEHESGWAVILTAALGILIFAGFPQLSEFFSHPTNVVATAVGYLVFGILWAFTKWYMLINKTKTEFTTFRDKYLTKNNLNPGYFSTAPKTQEDELTHDAYVMAIVRQFGYTGYHAPITVQEAIKCIRPMASRHKLSIMFWIGYWPFSVIWFLISDLVREFAEFVYNKVAGTFQRLSDRMFSDLA